MSSQYAGDPTAFPVDFTIPDDGVAPTAAAHNVAHEALGDRTAFLKREVDRAAHATHLTFLPKYVGTGGLCMVKQRYEPISKRRSFYAISTTAFDVLQCTFYGEHRVWPDGTTGSSLIPAPARFGVQPISDFEVDALGNVVAIPFGFDGLQVYDVGTTTWTKYSGLLGIDYEKWSISYDPGIATWCIAGSSPVGPTAGVWTSTNRTTWTPRTMPAGIPGGSFPTLAYADGVTIMQAFSGTNVYVARSTNGGVTWSAAQSFPLGFSVGTIGFHWPRPVKTRNAWLACVSNGVPAVNQPSVLLRSLDNGATWSVARTFTTVGMRNLAAIDRVAVAMVGPNQLAASLDDGTTWHWVDGNFDEGAPIAPRGVWAGDSRFIVAGGGSIHASVGFGSGKDGAL